jgi:all-trans-retinol 13,14-reductase
MFRADTRPPSEGEDSSSRSPSTPIGGVGEQRTLFKSGGIQEVLRQSGVAGRVKFVRAPNLYRSIFPDHDLRLPQMNLDGQIEVLSKHFPNEREGIRKTFDEMINSAGTWRSSSARGEAHQTPLPPTVPYPLSILRKPLSELLDRHLRDEKLKALISQLWGYYGLPPSRLSALYYTIPTMEYFLDGAWYPVGKSQALSNAFLRSIEEGESEAQFRAEVKEILVRDGTAYGVRTADGKEFRSDVVVSNANAHSTFHQLLDPATVPPDYLKRIDSMKVSLSCFQVYLGLSVEPAKLEWSITRSSSTRPTTLTGSTKPA